MGGKEYFLPKSQLLARVNLIAWRLQVIQTNNFLPVNAGITHHLENGITALDGIRISIIG